MAVIMAPLAPPAAVSAMVVQCALSTSLVHTVQCMEAEPRQCTRVGQGDDSSMASTPASCLVLWQRHPGHATHSPVPSRPKSLTPALTSYD
ncbi:hypothetical protein KC19_7G068800 [Ceratodon purpureus]|uniref:Secreted protein n=1 Tax=Ceratodon purpureus TaxID=3225 RepID=A0A8T0H5I6_CERPU|nr:hypothetical protein KC19_7G068800 [Ceratodon purpureus]